MLRGSFVLSPSTKYWLAHWSVPSASYLSVAYATLRSIDEQVDGIGSSQPHGSRHIDIPCVVSDECPGVIEAAE
jgi:hypothetical protein